MEKNTVKKKRERKTIRKVKEIVSRIATQKNE